MLTVRLASFIIANGTDWGSLVAALCPTALPAVVFFFFLLLRKRMVSGLTADAVEG